MALFTDKFPEFDEKITGWKQFVFKLQSGIKSSFQLISDKTVTLV